MSKKDKKIELQLSDSKVTINNAKVDGYALQTGKIDELNKKVTELEDKLNKVKEIVA